MIKQNQILIWTTYNKNSFRKKHKLNELQNEFKDVEITDFEISENDLTKIVRFYNDRPKYRMSKRILERFKIENMVHYKVIIVDSQCSWMWPINGNWVNCGSRDLMKSFFSSARMNEKNKIFLILNANLKDDLDGSFRSDEVFNTLNLKRKHSSQIQSINKSNIDGKIVSFYYLNDQKTRNCLNDQEIITKYRPLWHATGNKNEITGFQLNNIYFLPFGCDALTSILKNINLLLDDSNEFNEKKIFHLLKTKDPNSSLENLPFINNFWKKHSNKEKSIENLSKSKQELKQYIPKISLPLKALEYHGKPLESIIKKILENFKFEVLAQNEENNDQADIIFSFNYNQSKYIIVVEVKGYKENRIDRKPFSQLPIWANEFINENPNVKFDKMIKLIVINNGYKSNESSNYDQRILKIPENIKKHYGYKDVDSLDDDIVDDIKVITTLNLVKILYSDEEHGAKLLKKKLVSTKAMQIESD